MWKSVLTQPGVCTWRMRVALSFLVSPGSSSISRLKAPNSMPRVMMMVYLLGGTATLNWPVSEWYWLAQPCARLCGPRLIGRMLRSSSWRRNWTLHGVSVPS